MIYSERKEDDVIVVVEDEMAAAIIDIRPAQIEEEEKIPHDAP